MLIAVVAAIHLYIVALEMFLWTATIGRRSFRMTEEFAQQTRTLAANQGLYNLFLVAGMVWALVAGPHEQGFQPAFFFLTCVAVAGLYGAATVHIRILIIQSVPAILAMLALHLGI